MLILPILTTVLLSITFILFVLVACSMDNMNNFTKGVLVTVILTQLIAIMTVWLLYSVR